ncbi:thioesterase II family protein [Streptomyces griseus]|uniref:thioesterase II family protein n=1 Tax=Streptomyces griseus TaxID=1911 RepID=UPI0020C8130B|nr:alpha/beta fold hydrolase [Streptomyces griseus]
MGRGEWIRRFGTASDAAVRVICLPHAGGSAHYFRPLAAALSPAAELLAVQYPGRMDRVSERYVTDFAELTERTLDAVRRVADRPVVLFGHSMGALLGFQVAKRMEAEGIAPLALFASGARPPGRSLPPHTRPRDDEELMADLARLDGTDTGLLDNADMRALVLSTLRADYRMLRSHRRDDSVLACPVMSLTGDDDPVVSVDDARGWARHTAGPFGLRVFTGRHFYLDGHWSEVGTVITERAAALGPQRSG